MADEVVYLFDVDNTLLDNDRVIDDLREYLSAEFGEERQRRYWDDFERLRDELGYADYLGALQRFRVAFPHDTHLLAVSDWLIGYPFVERLYPERSSWSTHLRIAGRPRSSRTAMSSSSLERSSAPASGTRSTGTSSSTSTKSRSSTTWSGATPPALRGGRRQNPATGSDQGSIWRARNDGLPAAGPLRTRRRARGALSAGRRHGRANRRPDRDLERHLSVWSRRVAPGSTDENETFGGDGDNGEPGDLAAA